MELQYWNNGEPVLPIDNASMRALKYWLNGEPYVITYTPSGGAGDLKSLNSVAFADIKSVNGIPIADIKSINNISTT